MMISSKIAHTQKNKNNASNINPIIAQSPPIICKAIEFIDNVIHKLDQGKLPISVFLDLSKAFDTLDHDILLHKLNFYGVHGIALNWFQSYINGRTQYVQIEDKMSTLLPISTGVPQGSILGPLLFIIYINDICSVSSHFYPILYADDTTLIST